MTILVHKLMNLRSKMKEYARVSTPEDPTVQDASRFILDDDHEAVSMWAKYAAGECAVSFHTIEPILRGFRCKSLWEWLGNSRSKIDDDSDDSDDDAGGEDEIKEALTNTICALFEEDLPGLIQEGLELNAVCCAHIVELSVLTQLLDSYLAFELVQPLIQSLNTTTVVNTIVLREVHNNFCGHFCATLSMSGNK